MPCRQNCDPQATDRHCEKYFYTILGINKHSPHGAGAETPTQRCCEVRQLAKEQAFAAEVDLSLLPQDLAGRPDIPRELHCCGTTFIRLFDSEPRLQLKSLKGIAGQPGKCPVLQSGASFTSLFPASAFLARSAHVFHRHRSGYILPSKALFWIWIAELAPYAPHCQGIVMCSQMHAMVLTNERGEPVSNCVT